MKTTEPIRDKHQITQLVDYYLKQGQVRNHVLIVMAVHTALRISDLLLLRWMTFTTSPMDVSAGALPL